MTSILYWAYRLIKNKTNTDAGTRYTIGIYEVYFDKNHKVVTYCSEPEMSFAITEEEYNSPTISTELKEHIQSLLDTCNKPILNFETIQK